MRCNAASQDRHPCELVAGHRGCHVHRYPDGVATGFTSAGIWGYADYQGRFLPPGVRRAELPEAFTAGAKVICDYVTSKQPALPAGTTQHFNDEPDRRYPAEAR